MSNLVKGKINIDTATVSLLQTTTTDEELNYKMMIMMSKINETNSEQQEQQQDNLYKSPQFTSQSLKTILNNSNTNLAQTTSNQQETNIKTIACSNFEPHYWRFVVLFCFTLKIFTTLQAFCFIN